MSKSTEEQKVESGPMEVALLTEIADRLRSIELLGKAQVPEGVVEPIEKFRITDQRTPIKLRKAWFSVSLINDGPASVFVIVNTEKSFEEHEVLANETYNINMGRALITDLLCWCNPGFLATVRIVGIR